MRASRKILITTLAVGLSVTVLSPQLASARAPGEQPQPVAATHLAPKSITTSALSRDLRIGVNGPAVTRIQQALLSRGYQIKGMTIRGGPARFGHLNAATMAAIVKYKKDNGLGNAPVVTDAVYQSILKAADPRPNFIVIQTDDMIVDDLMATPEIKKLIGDAGATFTQALTPFALCCPSRAAMMTGCYPHNNRVQSNFPPSGGYVPWEKNNGTSFGAYWMQSAGYHTVHIGKYINGYGMYNRPTVRVPSGWSEWHGSADPSTYQMYGYRLNEPSRVNPFSSTVYGDFYTEEAQNYGTDVYTGKALRVIDQQARQRAPFLIQLAYLAPHVETLPLTDGTWKDSWADVDKPAAGSGIDIASIPPRAALRHQAMDLDGIALPQDPSFNEADRSDKQSFVRNLPALTSDDIEELRLDNIARKRSLFAVTEGVGAIVARLKATGQLDNTYIVFTGDNGYILGQHAITYGKYFPYEPALRIPMMMRGPGIPAHTVIGGITSEMDITPTILELAKVKATRPIDGISLLGVMTKKKALPSRTILLSSGPQQSANGTPLPLFDGVRTAGYAWWVYEDGFEEMYDLSADPYELSSVANDPAYLKTRLALIAEWSRMKDCKGAVCQRPTPDIPDPVSS